MGTFFWAPIPVNQYEIHSECSPDTGMPKKTLGMALLICKKYIFICWCIYHFLFFSSPSIVSIFTSIFLKEFVFAFTIPFTFFGIMKALVLQLNIYQRLVLKILIKNKLTWNARLFTSLGSATFKLSGSSF